MENKKFIYSNFAILNNLMIRSRREQSLLCHENKIDFSDFDRYSNCPQLANSFIYKHQRQ